MIPAASTATTKSISWSPDVIGTLADDDDVTVPSCSHSSRKTALGVVGEARLVGQGDRHVAIIAEAPAFPTTFFVGADRYGRGGRGNEKNPPHRGSVRRLSRALMFAADSYGTQVRKGGDIPYLGHRSVAGLVIEADGTENQAIAAPLHDAVEDAEDGDGESMLARSEASSGTRWPASSASAATPPWRRSRRGRLETGLHRPPRMWASDGAVLVSLADKLTTPGRSCGTCVSTEAFCGNAFRSRIPASTCGTTSRCWQSSRSAGRAA